MNTSSYYLDITSDLKKNRLKEAFMRTEEIDNIVTKISIFNKKKILLEGEKGVGKSVIINSVTRELLNNKKMKDYSIIKIKLSRLIKEGLIDEIDRVIASINYNYKGKIILMCNITEMISNPLILKNQKMINFLFHSAQMICEVDRIITRGSIKKLQINLDQIFDIITINPPTTKEIYDIAEQINRKYSRTTKKYLSKSSLNLCIDYVSKRSRETSNTIVRDLDWMIRTIINTTKKFNSEINLEETIKIIDNLYKKNSATKFVSRFSDMANELKKKIKGQDEAIDELINLSLSSTFLEHDRKSVMCALFVGPPGSGKTETAIRFSDLLYNKPPLIIDMGEYSDNISITKLLGASPGYTRSEEEGEFVKRLVEEVPCLILFDEIEKAHPDVLNILLHLIDEGRITSNHMRTVRINGSIIIMTSNIIDDSSPDAEELSKYLKRELIDRIHNIIKFRRLGRAAILEIIKREIKIASDQFNKRYHYHPIVSDKQIEELVRLCEGTSARQIKKEIDKKILSYFLKSHIDKNGHIY